MVPERICIIGAGAAGLCAARHAKRVGLSPVVFEANSVLGGTWVYTDKVGDNVHSSMYKNLRTNLPKEVMAFPDYPFSEAKTRGRSFLHHTEVLEYLEDYARQFDLLECIHLRTKVLVVTRNPFTSKWKVTIKNLDDNVACVNHLETLDFDGIMVCAGHYSVPNFPSMPNLCRFQGTQMHSHSYKEPELFAGKTVLVLGAGASGIDISIEIASTAKKVYLSHSRKELVSKLPWNMEAVAEVQSCVGEKSFHLRGSNMYLNDVDVLFFATGYQYAYPFLDDCCKISVSTHMVRPLFKAMISASYPSMCFIGIPFLICPFPLFDRQVQFYLQSLTGNIILPDTETMIEEEENEFRLHMCNGGKPQHYHKFGAKQWKYNDDLARLANIPALPFWMERIYETTHRVRLRSVTTYKQECYADWID